ncbi:MAG: hypothetical protein CMA63_06670 [Euryarchaeota archaeon]|nr:hypothetical protein [Euryarchaeota archaeon]
MKARAFLVLGFGHESGLSGPISAHSDPWPRKVDLDFEKSMIRIWPSKIQNWPKNANPSDKSA